MSLATAIMSRKRALKIGSNVELAKRIGVSPPTIYNVLAGRTPNARTVKRYAKFLGLSQDKIRSIAPTRTYSRAASR